MLDSQQGIQVLLFYEYFFPTLGAGLLLYLQARQWLSKVLSLERTLFHSLIELCIHEPLNPFETHVELYYLVPWYFKHMWC
jgi:hypothetical protein